MSQMTIEFGVGKELRAARLKAELKISDVAKELNLRVEHITAIEKDNYADLPGTTYVLGFVRSYARFLGLNEVHLIDRLTQSGFIPSLAPNQAAFEGENLLEKPPLLVPIFFVSLLLVSILAVVYFYSSEDKPKPLQEKETAATVVKPLKTSLTQLSQKKEIKKIAVTPQELIPLLVADKKVEKKVVALPVQKKQKKIKIIGTKPKESRVMLTAVADAWYQVYNPQTQKTYVNTVLKKGQSIWLTNDPEALIDLGRPHKIIISVDGQKLGRAGPSWGGVIKKLSTEANFLKYDYFGKGLDKKSYNRLRKNQ